MPAFWLLVITTGSLWFIINGIVVHGPSYLGLELNMDIQARANIASLTFLAAIAGKLLFGWLSDRYSKTFIMFAGVVNLGLGLLILRLTTIENPVILYGYAVVFGVGFAGTFTMIQLVIAEFFAGRSYGRILGILTMIDVGSAGLGISVIARLEGHFGSYLPVFEILIGQCCAVAALVYLLHRIRLTTSRQAQALPA